jgi:hypothetical protein
MIRGENLNPVRSWRYVAMVSLVLAGIAGVWLLGEHTPTNLGRSILAIGGAGLVAWWSTRRPVAAFGILFLLASLSRWTIELPIGNMRMEQPAIAAGLLAILYARRMPDAATMRRLLPIALAFMAYLGALTASSLLYSPDRADSLRMTLWIGLSMGGGLLAFMLLFGGDPGGSPSWLRIAAAGQATVGILVAVVFLTLGPVVFAGDPMPGMQDALASMPKVFGVSWEANLYSSLLGALSPFVIEEFRCRPRPRSAALVAVVFLGFAVGVSRGAYLALAAGLITYLGVLLVRKQRPRSLLLPVSVVMGAVVVGALVAPVLLPAGRDLNQPINLTTPGWGRGLAIGPYLLPGWSSEGLAGGSPASTGPSIPGTTTTHIVLPPYPDTIGFRLERIPVALKDLPRNPIIGLGANSFGQRHADPSQAGGPPDHIAILAFAALYESGVLGALGLAIGFVLILLAFWRASRHPTTGPMAAAYLGSLVCLLIAYQATNALNFALIWLIAGAGLAMAFSLTTNRQTATE